MINTLSESVRNMLKGSLLESHESENVNTPERIVSVLAGAFLAYKSISTFTKHPYLALQEALVSGLLVYRGASGYCPVYAGLGKDSTDPSAIHISERFIVNKPKEEVFAFWRSLENLPRFMKHLASVEERDSKTSYWRANLPGEIVKLSWNAEITREEENSYIGWQSVEGSMVDNAGKVEFNDALNGSGTELNIEISYFPPAGSLGQGIAKLLNGVFENMIRKDITNFKHYVEGEDYKTYKTKDQEVYKFENTFK